MHCPSLNAATLRVSVAVLFALTTLRGATSFEERRAEAARLLAEGRPREALELARILNREVPDDLAVYSLIAGTAMKLGLYQEAEKAAQTSLDLRPGNFDGLMHGAALRILYGDHEGALDFYRMALQRVPPTRIHEVHTAIGRLYFRMGQPRTALNSYAQALASNPNFAPALLGRAEIQPDATLLARCPKLGADCWRLVGNWKEFERAARGEGRAELVVVALLLQGRAADALIEAEAAVSMAPTVESRHAFARALAANGSTTEALAEVKRALAEGTKERDLLNCAASLADQAGDSAQAAKWRRMALRITPED